MSEKFYVKVVRLAVEATVIEVEALDEEQATLASIQLAADQGADAWSKITNEAEYTIHPLTAWQLDEDEGSIDLLNYEHHRFVALFADTSSAEGTVLLEPWMVEQSGLAVADLSSDWMEELEEVQEESAGEFYERLAEMAKAKQRGPAKIIDFAQAVAKRRLKLYASKEQPPATS